MVTKLDVDVGAGIAAAERHLEGVEDEFGGHVHTASCQPTIIRRTGVSYESRAEGVGVVLPMFGNGHGMDAVPLVALEREWRMLVRGRLALEFRRWRVAEPALAGCAGPERVIAFLWDPGASPVVKDRVLAALLRLARSESSAGRMVLQAMLPGLKALASVLLKPHHDRAGESVVEREELWQLLFVAMLERIRTYPLERRPRKIAANLVLDVKHVTLAELQRTRSGFQELPRDEPLEPVAQSSRFAAADVEEPMRRAVAAGAITAADEELLLQVDVDGMSLREAAARLGISYNAAKHRRQKARRELAMFLRPWTQDLYVQMDPEAASDRPSSGAYAPEEHEDTAEQTG